MRRASSWLPLFLVLLGTLPPSPAAHAVSVRSWSASSADEFREGTLEGTALDGEGSVRLGPTLQRLWGPGEGIVWDLDAATTGRAVFAALSSPTIVLEAAPGEKPRTWYESGDESLIAAIAADRSGGVYIGLSPDGRLMHATAPGEVREVADTGALFVWALALAHEDDSVWIGTGLPGRLLRSSPDGELHTVFDTSDDPVRCILVLEDGGVVFGTGGRGRVIRVDPQGRAFVLFDAEEAEVVALELGPDGAIYALAAQGSKQLAAAQSAATSSNTVRVTASPPQRPSDEQNGQDGEEAPVRAKPPAPRFNTTPGGVLYRIAANGAQRKLWSSPREVPFGLVRGADGSLLVATGDSGRIHAIDERGQSSVLIQIGSDQASALTRAGDGRIFVAGTTDARIEQIGPELRAKGSFISPAGDAGTVADWGRLRWESDRPAGSEVQAWVRVGNTAEPDATWSDWARLGAQSGAEVSAPPARWFQVRVDLVASGKGASPALRELEMFFRPHNRKPEIGKLEVQPAGVVFTRNPTQSSQRVGPVVASDPIVRQTVAGLRPVARVKPVRKSYELGARTASWEAVDPDNDALTFRLDIRREGTSAWIPLAVGIEDDFFGWDARGMPDGHYRVRLTAIDASDNPDGAELSDRRISATFRVDNTRPSIGDPRIRREAGRYDLEFVASDPGGSLAAAEIAVDSGDWQPLDPADGVADSPEEHYSLVIEPLAADANAADDSARPRTVKVRVTDSSGNMGGDAWLLDP